LSGEPASLQRPFVDIFYLPFVVVFSLFALTRSWNLSRQPSLLFFAVFSPGARTYRTLLLPRGGLQNRSLPFDLVPREAGLGVCGSLEADVIFCPSFFLCAPDSYRGRVLSESNLLVIETACSRKPPTSGVRRTLGAEGLDGFT